MRCSRCGNENPESNRFCGMCGGSLLAAPPPQAPPPAPEPVPAPVPSAAIAARPEPRHAAPSSDSAPIISGPSFLGLNQPGPASSSRTSGSSRNLDYLLEDEEEPKGGKGKIFLILAALALVLGLGYLRWRHEGLPFLTSATKRPPAAGQSTDPAQPAPGTASSPADSSSPSGTSAPAATQPAPSAATAPAENSSPGDPATPDAAVPSGSASTAAPASPPATKAADPNTASPDSSSDTADKPAESGPAAPAPKPRPIEKPTPAKPVDRVAEAEKYIYGRGVPQDCDRGLKLLRPAAEQANPRAMISLGALYSAGLCTPRDLPTSYRWFALALRKQPENQPLQADLQKLWSEMTQPERQLAIKLSQ